MSVTCPSVRGPSVRHVLLFNTGVLGLFESLVDLLVSSLVDIGVGDATYRFRSFESSICNQCEYIVNMQANLTTHRTQFMEG